MPGCDSSPFSSYKPLAPQLSALPAFAENATFPPLKDEEQEIRQLAQDALQSYIDTLAVEPEGKLHLAGLIPWANLGRRLRVSRGTPLVPRWPGDQVERLVAAVRRLDQEESRRLHMLLDRVHTLLQPLGEPLKLNFGLNRWLRGAREEAYSDWLAWLFTLLRPVEIGQVLRIPATHPVRSLIAAFPNAPVTVRREVWVAQGHKDAAGRLDITLRIGQVAMIVLEIKRGDAQTADTAKQEGYVGALAEEGLPFYPVLLVTEAPQENVHGFAVLRCADFCLALRRFVAEHMDDERGHVFLSFVLGLAATLEMNMLGLNVTARQVNLSTLEYLTKFCGEAA